VLELVRGDRPVALVSVNADAMLRTLSRRLWPELAIDRDSALAEPVGS
jgi:hypothetical protein